MSLQSGSTTVYLDNFLSNNEKVREKLREGKWMCKMDGLKSEDRSAPFTRLPR